MRRIGDSQKIKGSYQYNAITQGNSIQKFWHYSKQLAIKNILPPTKEDHVLDVGCGSGVISSYLGTYRANILGIDGNPDAIKFANQNYQTKNVHFRLGLVDELTSLNAPIDKIYCLEVLEHIYLEQAQIMLKSFYALLKPGGKVFLTTPNYKSLWPVIEWLIDRFKLAPKMLCEQHVEFYNKKKLATLSEKSNFILEYCSTNCFISPWVAPVSWKLAEKIGLLEIKLPFFWGSILIFILQKPE